MEGRQCPKCGLQWFSANKEFLNQCLTCKTEMSEEDKIEIFTDTD